jgi:hypothetical protein
MEEPLYRNQKIAQEILLDKCKNHICVFRIVPQINGDLDVYFDQIGSAVIRHFQEVQDKTDFNFYIRNAISLNEICVKFYNRSKQI